MRKLLKKSVDSRQNIFTYPNMPCEASKICFKHNLKSLSLQQKTPFKNFFTNQHLAPTKVQNSHNLFQSKSIQRKFPALTNRIM